MSRRASRGLSIFWQTLLLLLASLAVVQFVSVALIVILPPPRPEFTRLTDIAELLNGRTTDAPPREKPLTVSMASAPPIPPQGWIGNAVFTQRIADLAESKPERIRFWYEPDQRVRSLSRRYQRGDDLVPRRHHEPIFVNGFTAAMDTGQGWRVVMQPPGPPVANWQRRLILWFAVSALVLVPFAWAFARRLTRPIRRFADAADRLGTDPQAPCVPEEGPAELRTTAVALNRMQARIGSHLAERTAMIGAIAHDLRTPLARIAFRIEGAPDEIRTKVQHDIQQMQTMITDTINFVKGTATFGQSEAIDLSALVQGIVAQGHDTGSDLTIEAVGPLMVSGNRIALCRVFENLADNAIAYGCRATIRIIEEGTQVTVLIEDEGPGLDEKEIGRVFLPFERGDPSRNRSTGGTGLGLAIAREIVERHGGTISLANRQPRGLAVRVSLPLLRG